jgi:anti-anti-sigma factor
MTATTPFEAAVRVEADRVVLDMRGEISAAAEEALNAAYAGAIVHDPAAIVLNFGDVTYINSTGIALIVGLLAQARKERLALSVYGLTDHYLHIFQITRLADFMTIYEDERSALVGETADRG